MKTHSALRGRTQWPGTGTGGEPGTLFGLFEAGDPLGALTAVLWAALGLGPLTGVLATLLPRRAREEAPA